MAQRLAWVGALTAAVLLISVLAVAQEGASLSGTAKDSDGAALPGVTVTLTGPSGSTFTAVTDASGDFEFTNVPPGSYRVKFELAGFSLPTASITLTAGSSGTANLTGGGIITRVFVPPRAAAEPSSEPPPPPPPALAMPAPAARPPAAQPSGGGAAAAEPEPPYKLVPVLYATDRRRKTADAAYGATFSEDRSDDELQYGRAIVTIPRDHRPGQLESPSWLHLEFRPDPNKHVVLMRSETVEKAAFFQDLHAAATGHDVLVFIHGYNVTFEDALRRTGQLASDLQFQGPAVAYTWPAQDSATKYLIAQGNVDWCKPHLVQFLTDLADRSGARRIHVIVHSLGNRIFARAVDGIMTANPQRQALFHTIVMAAADIDVGEFRQIAANLRRSTDAMTLYVSSTDKALKASKKLAKYQRVGQGGKHPVLIAGIDTVDASAVDRGFFWDIDHSYYGDSRSVVGDMWELIGCDWPVTQRDALSAIGTQDPRLWQLTGSGSRRTQCTPTRPITH